MDLNIIAKENKDRKVAKQQAKNHSAPIFDIDEIQTSNKQEITSDFKLSNQKKIKKWSSGADPTFAGNQKRPYSPETTKHFGPGSSAVTSADSASKKKTSPFKMDSD